jgi:hypothetical protein
MHFSEGSAHYAVGIACDVFSMNRRSARKTRCSPMREDFLRFYNGRISGLHSCASDRLTHSRSGLNECAFSSNDSATYVSGTDTALDVIKVSAMEVP